MEAKIVISAIFRSATTLALCLLVSTTFAQTKDGKKTTKQDGQLSASELIRNATDGLRKKQKYELNYKIKEGDKIRWSVEHTASTRTKISDTAEETSSRSVSIKSWTVDRVDTVGNMTFVHAIESVKMWHQIGENDPVSFDSRNVDDVPLEYESVVDKVGRPLATITINAHGQVLDRKTNLKSAKFGAGDITIPLPKNPIAIGHQWYVPSNLSATDKSGRRLQLKSRIHYTLSNVKGQNAFISFRTEVLTPIESEKVRSQIMQQMTKGYLVFDMERGLPTRKEVEWDEKVHGYEGPNSFLSYAGKLSEKLLTLNADSLTPLDADAKKVSELNKPESKTKTRK